MQIRVGFRFGPRAVALGCPGRPMALRLSPRRSQKPPGAGLSPLRRRWVL